ncbi:MAG: YqgE/AlgH family protein [Sphingopyxis sp.]
MTSSPHASPHTRAQPTYFTGQFLLALPAIGDPRFDHSIILMISHDEDGAMGIAIGDPGDVTVGEVLEEMALPAALPANPAVLVGGPVEPQRGFVIHSRDWGGEGTIDVAGLFAVSASLDVLRAIAGGRGPRQWQLAMGYAGWSAGQLEGEMMGDAWHLTPSDPAILFDIAPQRRWAATMARDGINPARIAPHGGTA